MSLEWIEAVNDLCPGVSWRPLGRQYADGVEWITAPTSVPTAAQVAAEVVRLADTRAAAAANRRTVEQAVTEALAQNRTIVTGADSYLAGHITLGASPTTAQVAAAVKAYGLQVKALTTAAKWSAQQRNGLIRLALNQLDATD